MTDSPFRMAIPVDFTRAEYCAKSMARRASGKTSIPSWVAGMSSLTTTDLPSKKSLSSGSLWA